MRSFFILLPKYDAMHDTLTEGLPSGSFHGTRDNGGSLGASSDPTMSSEEITNFKTEYREPILVGLPRILLNLFSQMPKREKATLHLRRDAEDPQDSRSSLSNMMEKTPYRRADPLHRLLSYLLFVQRRQFQGTTFPLRISPTSDLT
jgi:hypothetical protein